MDTETANEIISEIVKAVAWFGVGWVAAVATFPFGTGWWANGRR